MAEELPAQLKTLVNHLREQNSEVSLSDVASVTEVLIGTMQSFFKGIDTSIYRECRNLSEYINNARSEIASIGPDNTEEAHFPRAGMELDAIVLATEEATDTIMNSAEEIMEVMEGDLNENKDKIEAAVMNIFEACSFQDITGQRISKVVHALSHIEGRVKELRSLMGVTEEDVADAQAKEVKEKVDEPLGRTLAQGPALDGEGIDQTEVDELLSFDAPGEDSSDEKESASDESIETSPEENDKSELKSDSEDGRTTSQEDIDALFN